MIGFHVTSRDNRESILETGLLARDTAHHNYRACVESLPGNAGVRAVYAHCDPAQAADWAYFASELRDAVCDVWAFDVEDAETDPHWSGFRVRRGIPPEQLRLVASGEARQLETWGRNHRDDY